MPTTVTLPDMVVTKLQKRAATLDISLDDLVAHLFDEILISKRTEFPISPHGNHRAAFAEVLATVRAIPPNPESIERGEKVGDMAYIQELLDNPPTDTVTKEEWERLWPAFEQELKELDVAHDVAERQA